MKIGKIAIIGILLLSIINSAGAVWIYTDVDIIVGDITLNTVTTQNFSYVEIGTDYTNLSWDGSTYYNITFLTNMSSSAADVQYDGAYTTNLSIDVYNFTYSEPTTTISMKIITNNSVIDASTGSLSFTEVNSTHRRYYYVYNPSDTLATADLGPFDVNISVLMENNTLTYTGYELFTDVFTVSTGVTVKTEIDQPPINGTTDDDLVELNGFCSMGTDSTNFSTDVYADVYSPSGWTVNYVYMRFYTNNSELDQNITATSYTQVNSTYRRYSCEYNPSNTLSQADMGEFDVNVSVSAENTTHEYTNYTMFNDVFEVYKLLPVSNATSEYNATYDSVNFSWGAFGEQVYYFNSSGSEQWNNYPANLIDGDIDTYARAQGALLDTHELDNNTCNGTNLGTIYSVSLRFYTHTTGGAMDVDLTPVFESGDGTANTYTSVLIPSWSSWYDITTDTNAPSSWSWSNISSLDAKLESIWGVYASIVQLRVLYYPDLVNSTTDRYIVVRSNTTAPICPTDGYIVHNSTAAVYNTARDFTEAYFTVYAYNETTQSYSEGTALPWGGLGMNCFNESNPSQAIDFDIEITNSDASEVYTNSSLSNPFYISLEDIPYGTNTIFVVSNSSYKQRLYYKDLLINHFYNFSFYLPPHETPVDNGTGDDGGNTTETRLYLLTVVGPQNEYTSPPIEGAKISIARYINVTDSYEEIGSVLTSANGEAEFFLIPFNLYKVTISKDGYETKISDYIPSTDVFTKTFRITPTTTDPTEYDIFWDNIIFTGEMYINGTIKIVYSDNNESTIDTHIYLYDIYNGTFDLNDTNIKTGNNDFSYWITGINTSRDHEAWLYFNNTANYAGVTSPVVITVFAVNKTWGDDITKINLEERFTGMFGPMPLGYVNIISIIIPIIILCIFGPLNAGIGIMGAGVSLGFVQAFLAVWATDTFNPFLALMCPVIIALGFLYILSVRGSEYV